MEETAKNIYEKTHVTITKLSATVRILTHCVGRKMTSRTAPGMRFQHFAINQLEETNTDRLPVPKIMFVGSL